MVADVHVPTDSERQENRRKAKPGRTIRVKILRCEGPGQPSRWETFDVKIPRGSNVISVLQQIARNPVTTDGQTTTPPVWDSGCLEEVCGSCTMLINGQVRQSCSCLMDEYAPEEGDVITLEPMSKFPVIRDLWVDRERLFHNLKRVKAWVPIDGSYDLGAGPREAPETQAMRYKLSECMSCGCCLEACPPGRTHGPGRRLGLRQRAELRQGLPEAHPPDRVHRRHRPRRHHPLGRAVLPRVVTRHERRSSRLSRERRAPRRRA